MCFSECADYIHSPPGISTPIRRTIARETSASRHHGRRTVVSPETHRTSHGTMAPRGLRRRSPQYTETRGAMTKMPVWRTRTQTVLHLHRNYAGLGKFASGVKFTSIRGPPWSPRHHTVVMLGGFEGGLWFRGTHMMPRHATISDGGEDLCRFCRNICVDFPGWEPILARSTLELE